MGQRNREIEVKLKLSGITYATAVSELTELLREQNPLIRIGSSLDTYWVTAEAPEAQFLRVRERDGIRQITVKGKDRGDNLNRIEVDIDSTSETHRIHRLMRCLLGRPAGIIQKTYQVWELESEYDTVCVYQLTQPVQGGLYVEMEARSMERMLELEQLVLRAFPRAKRAEGSLFEMYVERKQQ